MSIGKRIKEKRIEKGMTLEELGQKANVQRATVQRYESGVISNIPSDKIEMLAAALETTPSYLMGWEYEETSKPSTTINNIEDFLEIEMQKIPLIGTIACGLPIEAEEYFEGYVEVGADVNCDFALRCSGDSMINARIMDGDIVFIRKQHTVNDGEIAAVIIDGEATLKRVFFSDGFVTLQAENPAVKPIIFKYDEYSQSELRIIGKAVAFQSDVR